MLEHTQELDPLRLLEAATASGVILPPELEYLSAAGPDREEPLQRWKLRLWWAWVRAWPEVTAAARDLVAGRLGLATGDELHRLLLGQALGEALARLTDTYGDSAKVAGLHRRAVAEEEETR